MMGIQLLSDVFLQITFTILTGILLFSYFLLLFVRAVEKYIMLKWVHPSKLTEGDWIAKDIKVNNRFIVGPRSLGIEKRQIAQLKRLAAQGKVKKVQIKEGIPFVPSFFIAYVFALLFGNVIFFII